VVLVRPITRDDVSAAARLLRAGSLTPEFEHVDDTDAYWGAVEETRRRRGDVLVADDDGQVVGVCQVMIFPHFQHTGRWCCELEGVHVREDHRGQGVGGQMLAAAEELARARDCYRIQLTSRNVREDAHRFYRRLGFEQNSQGFKKRLEVEDFA
jgi:GNAT superfamily N-acetyltransferase